MRFYLVHDVLNKKAGLFPTFKNGYQNLKKKKKKKFKV